MLKAHSDDPVPVLISGNRISPDQTQRFSEEECKDGELGTMLHGTELMPKLMIHLK
jgi:2,3-bisphosphoglycerate-independent phosphoglycerate mutase